MKTRLAIAIIALFAYACSSAPKSDEAKVGDAQEVTAVEEAVSYAVSSDSHVTWVGSKLGGQHNGTIGISEGSIDVKGGEVVGARFTIDMNNIAVLDLTEETGAGKLVGHLQSPDFFATDSFPTATFELVSAAVYEAPAATEGGEPAEESEYKIADPTHTLTGNLTLRGTTKSISFPAKVSVDGDITAVAKFNIDRTDWGVSYGDESTWEAVGKDKVINNTVNVGFNVTASKPAAPATDTES